MFIVVQHTILDQHNFMNIVQQNKLTPDHLTLFGFYPSANFDRAVCLWEASDISELQDFLERTFGSITRNEYMIVNEDAAIGLPAHVL